MKSSRGKGGLTEADVERFRSRIKAQANYKGDDSEQQILANTYKGIRGGLNDILNANTGYKKAMDPVRQNIKELEAVANVVSLKEVKGDKSAGRYEAVGDTALNKLKTMANKEDSMSANQLTDFLKKYSPADEGLIDRVQKARNELALRDRSPVFRTQTGLGIGMAAYPFVGPLGPIAGTIIGGGLDVYGRQGWRKAASSLKTPDISFEEFQRFLTPAAIKSFTSPAYSDQNPYAPIDPNAP